MNLPVVRSVQSPEITNALQQYSNRAQRHWERIVLLLRKEAFEKGVSFKKRNNGESFLSRVCDNEFFRAINPTHPEYVIEDMEYISAHPLVTRNSKGLYLGASLISLFEETDHGVYNLIFGPAVVQHYLEGALTVEYDANLIDTFRKQFTPVLYKRGCLISSNVLGGFEISEEEIRLLLSIDLVDDIENLKKKKISDIDELPITRTNGYDRFNQIVSRLIDPALDEIKNAYEEGKCPFVLRKEVKEIKVKTGKRGAPKRKNYISFYIEQPDTFVEAEEITDETLELEVKDDRQNPTENRKSVVQIEIPFPDADISVEEKLSQIEELLDKALKASKGYQSYRERYPRCITDQIRERLRFASQSNLADAVLAWAEYTQQEAKNPIDFACKLKGRLEEELSLVYEGARSKGTKENLKWDGKAPVKFPPVREEDNVNAGASPDTAPSAKKDWFELWKKCREAAIKSGSEVLSLAFDLMFCTDYSDNEKKLTIQIPSYIVREYALIINNSEFLKIINTYFGDGLTCNFVEKYNLGPAELLKKFQKMYEVELAKHRQQIESAEKGQLDKLKEIWQSCQTELGNRDKVFLEKVSLESFYRKSNTLLIRVIDEETQEHIEKEHVGLMTEVFRRHFRVAIELKYRITPERTEPRFFDSSFENESNSTKK